MVARSVVAALGSANLAIRKRQVTDDAEMVANNSTSVDDGLQTFRERNPKEFFARFNSIKPALEWIHSQKKTPLEFDIYDFRRDIEPLNFLIKIFLIMGAGCS